MEDVHTDIRVQRFERKVNLLFIWMTTMPLYRFCNHLPSSNKVLEQHLHWANVKTENWNSHKAANRNSVTNNHLLYFLFPYRIISWIKLRQHTFFSRLTDPSFVSFAGFSETQKEVISIKSWFFLISTNEPLQMRRIEQNFWANPMRT